jgi:curli biogenesis system outer membrane secretion channel CsgG
MLERILVSVLQITYSSDRLVYRRSSTMRRISPLFLAPALLSISSAVLRAQGEISIAVLPFGFAQSASQASRSGPTFAQEVIGVLSESGLYTVIDRSTDRAIEEELKKAEGFRNFDSRIELTTTARLNASVLLIGVIESQRVEAKRATKPGERPSYSAQVAVRLKLVRTQTGELIKSQLFNLRNETAASKAVSENSLTKKLPKFLQDELNKKVDERAAAQASKSDVDLLDRTPEDAIRGAAQAIKKPLAEFIQNSYGAVVAANKAK